METAQNPIDTHAIEAHRIYRYYGMLSTRFARYHQMLMLGVAAPAVAAAVMAGVELPSAPIIAAAGIAAATATVAPILDYSRRAAVAASTAHLCMDLTDDWEDLWIRSINMEDHDIQLESERLMRRLTRATAPAALQQGFYDEKLNRRADKEAKKDWNLRHDRTSTRPLAATASS
ncbi:MAG: hypothetical protein OXL97_11745 [Chloroflexota bacterium]|nr:hypothetical protein [Chloroflexota bacterium]MDE2884649.1 hypothetical protein [Chloroflexota bacterium]